MSWQALLIHLLHKVLTPGADPSLVADVATVAQAWAAIQQSSDWEGSILLGSSSWGTASG
jgi:hypothetical protein